MECDKNSITEKAQHVYFRSKMSIYSKICVEFAFLMHNSTLSIRFSLIQ